MSSVRPLGQAWAHLSHVPLRKEASDRSECVNEVLGGETVQELELGPGDWVRVELPDGYQGWMDRRQLRPVTFLWNGHPFRLSTMHSSWKGVAGGWLPAGCVVRELNGTWFLGEDEVTPLGEPPKLHESDMSTWAESMLGVPYHWGGRCGWGYDCSGLVSLAAALVGLQVPRDASEQFAVGTEVPMGSIRRDDVAFFENSKGQITHVGLCDGTGHVIHASGQVRRDRLDGTELMRVSDGATTHNLAGIRRWTEG